MSGWLVAFQVNENELLLCAVMGCTAAQLDDIHTNFSAIYISRGRRRKVHTCDDITMSLP